MNPDERSGVCPSMDAPIATAAQHAPAEVVVDVVADGIPLVVPAFDDFYRERYAHIARALAYTLGDVDLAREATDEAMARAYGRWAQLGGTDNPSGWVYRTGLNWARSVLRRARRVLPRTTAQVIDAPAVADPTLRAALDRLPDRLRAVVVCRHLLDWSTEDTAAALGVNPGTVKSRLHRALQLLERSLATLDPTREVTP